MNSKRFIPVALLAALSVLVAACGLDANSSPKVTETLVSDAALRPSPAPTVTRWQVPTSASGAGLAATESTTETIAQGSGGALSQYSRPTVPINPASAGQVSQLVQLGGGSDMSEVAFTYDGRMLANLTDDGIRIYDIDTLRQIRSLEFDTEAITASVAVSPVEVLLAFSKEEYAWTGDASWTLSKVEIVDLETGGEPRTLAVHKVEARDVAFSPDGLLLAVGLYYSVEFWPVGGGEEILRSFPPEYGEPALLSMAFSPDGGLLARGAEDGTIRIWDAGSGAEMRALKGHHGDVETVAFSPDGSLLASGSSDETVKLWDAATGTEVRTLRGHAGWVGSVAFSPDGAVLASGSDDRSVRLWDVATGTQLAVLPPGEKTRSVIFSPDGSLLATGSIDGTVRLWGVLSGVPSNQEMAATTSTPQPPQMASAPVQRSRPTAQEADGMLSIWNFFRPDSELDLPSPGAREFCVELAQDRSFIWPFYWCAVDEPTLAENLKSITVEFFIDNAQVPDEDILEYEDASQGWACHQWATKVWDWREGEQVLLTIKYSFREAVNDGRQVYPAGEYHFELLVNVAER